MKRSKVFLLFVIVFVILMVYTSYDISRRTTFPGSKPQLKERVKKQLLKEDSATVKR